MGGSTTPAPSTAPTRLPPPRALRLAPTILPQQETGLSRGELKRRIQEISGESPVGRAVQRAVEAVTMAIVAAASAGAAASSS